MQYILYVAQDSNFQSRSALIPAVAFLQSRGAEWQVLKAACRTEIVDGKVIDNLLWEEIHWENRVGTHVVKPHSQLLGDLRFCADWRGDGDLEQDPEWVRESHISLCNGFSHVKNYLRLCKLTSYKGEPISIVDSVLVLEKRDDREYVPPPFDTVRQLLDSFNDDENKEN